MKALKTAHKAHVTERQKAWARLALLTVVGLVCPPLAAARSGAVWGIYLVLVVAYSLWTVRLTRTTASDRQLGYLLCVTDAAVLVPILVWSLGTAMRVVLVLLWAAGAGASVAAARASARTSKRTASSRRGVGRPSAASRQSDRQLAGGHEAPLERALRVRLRVLQAERTRFAIVLLQIAGPEALVADRAQDATKEMLREVGRRGLRILGPDAQLFLLPGARLAFVFATEAGYDRRYVTGTSKGDRLEPYDVESVAMALAKRACEQAVAGRPLECVVGWASAPADGTTADDLMYAAESGALSTDAFRRVGGSHIPVPEPVQRRAIAG